jgi:hypothetical protein
MPTPVRAAQVLMYVVAGLTAVLAGTALLTTGVSAAEPGRVTWFALPGLASLALAVLIPKRGTTLWRAIIALETVYILLSLGRLAGGDTRGLVNLVIPSVILVLLTRPNARSYFRQNAGR